MNNHIGTGNIKYLQTSVVVTTATGTTIVSSDDKDSGRRIEGDDDCGRSRHESKGTRSQSCNKVSLTVKSKDTKYMVNTLMKFLAFKKMNQISFTARYTFQIIFKKKLLLKCY